MGSGVTHGLQRYARAVVLRMGSRVMPGQPCYVHAAVLRLGSSVTHGQPCYARAAVFRMGSKSLQLRTAQPPERRSGRHDAHISAPAYLITLALSDEQHLYLAWLPQVPVALAAGCSSWNSSGLGPPIIYFDVLIGFLTYKARCGGCACLPLS